jgi:hypothetical protein
MANRFVFYIFEIAKNLFSRNKDSNSTANNILFQILPGLQVRISGTVLPQSYSELFLDRFKSMYWFDRILCADILLKNYKSY